MNVWKPLSVLIIFIMIANPASARVGESKGALEKRLLSGHKASSFLKADMPDVIKEMDYPYKNIIRYFPKGAEQMVYFKTDSNERVNRNDLRREHPDAKKRKKTPKIFRIPDEGWVFHVVYYRGKVVLESYSKARGGINSFERNALLGLNKGKSFWNEADPEDLQDNILRFEFERNDKAVRVSSKNDNILFFSPEFSNGINEVHKAEAEEIQKTNEQTAPSSVSGF